MVGDFIFAVNLPIMKKYLLGALLVIILGSCHFTRGSGNIITEKRSTGEFRGVSVAGGFEVELKNGPVTEVTVESDDNILKYIETRVSGDVLKIRVNGLHNFGDVHLKVYVTAPLISNISATGGADVVAADALKFDGRMVFHSSGGSSITAQVDAPEVEAESSSGSSLKLGGRTKVCHATSSSGANLKAGDLMSESTTVTASSGATAHVHASLNLQATASSGASILYRGGAVVQKTVSSGGSVEKEN
jgi:hypothetical protein